MYFTLIGVLMASATVTLEVQWGFAQTRLHVAFGHRCSIPGRIHSCCQQGQTGNLWSKQMHTSSNILCSTSNMKIGASHKLLQSSRDESVTQRDRSDTDSPLLWVCPVKDEDPEPQPKHWPFRPARNKTQLSQTVSTVTATLAAALEEFCLTPTHSPEAVRESRKSFCPPFIDSRTVCLRSAAFRQISSLIRSAFFHSTWARASASTSMWSRSFLCHQHTK